MTIESKTRITGVTTVGVPVADQERALDFYRGRLGFETVRDVPMPGGGRWIQVAPVGVTTSIALVQAQDDLPTGINTGVRFVTSDVSADHDAMVAAGVDADDVLRWPGVPPMFAFRDQDGNGFVVIEEDRPMFRLQASRRAATTSSIRAWSVLSMSRCS